MEAEDSSHSGPGKIRRAVALVTLIAAGEAIFLLPFVVARIFRPTLLSVFEISNLELGAAFSLYGIIAMASYFPGGPLADRFSARNLIVIALLSTSLGGFVLAFEPSLNAILFVYAYWGLTTILLFWAALIRATREWGGVDAQGKAFGFLDGGRGLVAALLGLFSVSVFSSVMPENAADATPSQKAEALREVILWCVGFHVFVAALVWIILPPALAKGSSLVAENSQRRVGRSFDGVKNALRRPAVWMQSLIIICAYVGYKGTDDFSLYAQDVLGYDEVAAAKLGALSLWLRPVSAVAAGFLADRISASRSTLISFVLVLAGSALLASGWIPPDGRILLLAGIVTSSLGIHALRGLYYAIMGETRIPLAFTGSAVGVVSVVGYTPDVFFGPLMGYLIDRSPGAAGHEHVFAVIAAFAAVGFIATLGFRRLTRTGGRFGGGKGNGFS